jgi:hypothetical protein
MYEYSCKVTRVVDGDTCDCIIDCGFSIFCISVVFVYMVLILPSHALVTKMRRLEEKWLRHFLKDAIENGEKVVIQTKLKDSRGKFGRVLGEIIVDGVNINQAMVENYHAAAYFGQSKEAIEAVHLSNRTKLIELGKFTPVEV